MSGSGYNPPTREVNIKFDINGDGKVEDWELAGDETPIILGAITMVMTAVHWIVFFLNDHATKTGFSFTTYFNAGMTFSFLLSILFDLTGAIIFLVFVLGE